MMMMHNLAGGRAGVRARAAPVAVLLHARIAGLARAARVLAAAYMYMYSEYARSIASSYHPYK
jgi:hypothetical protein